MYQLYFQPNLPDNINRREVLISAVERTNDILHLILCSKMGKCLV